MSSAIYYFLLRLTHPGPGKAYSAHSARTKEIEKQRVKKNQITKHANHTDCTVHTHTHSVVVLLRTHKKCASHTKEKCNFLVRHSQNYILKRWPDCCWCGRVSRLAHIVDRVNFYYFVFC